MTKYMPNMQIFQKIKRNELWEDLVLCYIDNYRTAAVGFNVSVYSHLQLIITIKLPSRSTAIK